MQVLQAGTWIPRCWLKQMNSYFKFSGPPLEAYTSPVPKTRTCIPNLHNYFGCLCSEGRCRVCFCKYRVYSDDTEPEISSHSLPSAALPSANPGRAAKEGLLCQQEVLYVLENANVGHLAATLRLSGMVDMKKEIGLFSACLRGKNP